jgi:hypothetical protein
MLEEAIGPGVRKEWDGVLPDVQQGMNELQSEQLAQLVSLGGWLRGTEALTALVLQNYSIKTPNFCGNPRYSITSRSDSRE